MQSDYPDEARRRLLQTSLFGALSAFLGAGVAGCRGGGKPPTLPVPVGVAPFGPLRPADPNGLRLPAGFESRVVARSGATPLAGTGFVWHAAPDGGATFPATDGGWIYVSNSELDSQGGGAGALRFDSLGRISDAYPVLSGTTRNCAGGPTPWGTWLSCEEIDNGHVWECDPRGRFGPARLPALGAFRHEAAAVDPVSGTVYLTEDQIDGCFYRYIPRRFRGDGTPDLTTGSLQVAEIASVLEGPVIWHDIPDPDGAMVPTRRQVAASTPFNRGEGLWYDIGVVYIATTGDNIIWAYDVVSDEIAIIYDDDFFPAPILRGVDNLTVSPRGDVLVAEDGDDLQLVALTPLGEVLPVLQLVGHEQSEITGPAFDPSGSRLYFSSQRGTAGLDQDGITFEVRGPFSS